MTPASQVAIGARALQGRHVLLLILSFFAIIFAVNGVLLYYALATHSGLVAVEPYRKGLAYNDRIAADQRQSSLGWRMDLDVSPAGQVTITLADQSAKPITGAIVNAKLGRPASSRTDVPLHLTESAPGRYEAKAPSIEPGAWQADIEIRKALAGEAGTADPVYRARRRLWLKP